MADLQRIVTFLPAFDERDPDPEKDIGVSGDDGWSGAGVSGVVILFALKGERGAISFSIHTGWYLPEQREVQIELAHIHPNSAGVCCHSPVPIYEWQDESNPTFAQCEWLDGKPCWLESDDRTGEYVLQKLIAEGDEAMWGELEDCYNRWLKEADDEHN